MAENPTSVPPEPPTLSAAPTTCGICGSATGNPSHGNCTPTYCRATQATVRAYVAALRAELAEATVERRAADYLAGVCSLAVHRHRIDARSEIVDALLDYACTLYGDSNPIGGVDATYQKLRAARAASGEDATR